MHVYGPRRFSLCKKIPNLKSMIVMFGEFFLANKVGTHLVYLYGIMTDQEENEGYKGVVVGINPKGVRKCKAKHPKKQNMEIQVEHGKIGDFPHPQYPHPVSS